MFLLVNNFKMIGMLLKVVYGQVQKSQQKHNNKGFPNLSTWINYVLGDYFLTALTRIEVVTTVYTMSYKLSFACFQWGFKMYRIFFILKTISK